MAFVLRWENGGANSLWGQLHLWQRHLLLWWMGGEALVTTFFLENRKRENKFQKKPLLWWMGVEALVTTSSRACFRKIANYKKKVLLWWMEGEGLVTTFYETRNTTKILLLWWMGGERLVTPRAWFCKIKKRKKIANWKKNSFEERVMRDWWHNNLIRTCFWGHPKNYMLCKHISFQCPLKLEIEKCWWIKGLKMKEF